MQVVDEGAREWFLLDREGELFFDVNCNHSAAGYNILFPLSPDEVAAYRLEGRDYLTRFARAVHMGGPWSSDQLRNVSPEYGKEVMAAVTEWRKTHPQP